MKFEFKKHERLDLEIPIFYVSYEELTKKEQSYFHEKAQKICASLPEKIKKLDEEYMDIFSFFWDGEENSMELFEKLNQLSEDICEINVWYYRLQGHFLQSGIHF